jgi:hypothetical protein
MSLIWPAGSSASRPTCAPLPPAADILTLPWPGSLERRAQVQSLERLFEIEGASALPATLHLHQPATALAVQHGRRWTLQERGKLSVVPDPLRRDTAQLLANLEARLARLEGEGTQPG